MALDDLLNGVCYSSSPSAKQDWGCVADRRQGLLLT